jgi:hypothetical protein
MAIAKRSDSKINARAREFIETAGESVPAAVMKRTKGKPIMIRIDAGLLGRVDHAAKRLGLSRSAFIVSSAARAVEAME